MLDLARPWPLKLAVDHAIGHQPLGGPLAPLGRLGSGGLAAVAAAAMLVLVGIGSLVGYLTTWLGSASTERVGAGLREAVFARMLDLALPFHDRHRAGDLVTRLTGDVTRVEDALVAWFTTLLPEAVTLAGMIVVMLAVDVPLALTAMLAAPPLALMVAMRRARIRSTQRAARDANASLAANATDLLRNVRVVQAFGREPEARRRFGENSAASVRTALTAMDLEARFAPVADLVLAAGSGAVLWIGVGAVTSGRITLGTLLVVLSYLSGLYGPIRSLARLARTLARGAASRERIMEVLAAGETVADAPDAIEAAPPRQGLALRGVWFAYPGGTAVLRNLDLDLAAGEWVCVVGPTGVGKSTLLNLLLRFYDPTGGTVELDGVPLDRLSLASLRRQLALVPRTPGCWTARSPRTSRSAGRRRTRRRSGRPAASRSSTSSPTGCRTAGTPSSARAACACPAASAAGWRWPGPWSVTRPCCCWTSRPAGSTRPARTPCCGPSNWRCARAPSSPCPTSLPWPPGPTVWSCSTAAGSPSRAGTRSCSLRTATTPACGRSSSRQGRQWRPRPRPRGGEPMCHRRKHKWGRRVRGGFRVFAHNGAGSSSSSSSTTSDTDD